MISPTQTVKFFEAEKPEYKKDYRDEDNHIGGYYSSKKKMCIRDRLVRHPGLLRHDRRY